MNLGAGLPIMIVSLLKKIFLLFVALPILIFVFVCLPWAMIIYSATQIEQWAAVVIKSPTERVVLLTAAAIAVLRQWLRYLMSIGASSKAR